MVNPSDSRKEQGQHFFYFLKSLPEYMFIDFRKRGKEGQREWEKHQCERETLIGASQATQACALTGNQT